jgi:hypothetical protein
MNVGAEHVTTYDVFATADGYFIMIEAGPPYPKLLNGYLDFFDCPNTSQALAQRIATWGAHALEHALVDTGLPVCRAVSRG